MSTDTPAPTSAEAGAVDLDACPRKDKRRACRCSPCTRCGYGEHMAVHGPRDGEQPGSKPWDHQFEAGPS